MLNILNNNINRFSKEHFLMNPKKQTFLLMLFITIGGCSEYSGKESPSIYSEIEEESRSANQEHTKQQDCEILIKIVSSSQNFVRVKHPLDLKEEVNRSAFDHCNRFKKISNLRKQRCDSVCCTSSHFCVEQN